MLYLLFLLGTCAVLSGCDASHINEDERHQLVRRYAEEYYLKHAGPNSGYEFVELTPIDTVRYKDNITYRRKYLQGKIDYNLSMLHIAQTKQDSFPTVNFADKINEYQTKADKYRQVLAGIDSLEAALGNETDEVASYTYLYKLKAHNAAALATGQPGPKELQTYYIQTNAGFGVLNFTADTAGLYPNPNDFPGYREMAGSILVDEE